MVGQAFVGLELHQPRDEIGGSGAGANHIELIFDLALGVYPAVSYCETFK